MPLARHLARAALEAVAYQTLDLDRGHGAATARAHGSSGSTAAWRPIDWFCQFLADILEAPVERPRMLETTALGAAFLAGLATGVWADLEALSAAAVGGAASEPTMDADAVGGWWAAVARTMSALTKTL